MFRKEICYDPIGVVHSPYESPADIPKHASAAVDASGTVELDEKYGDGLAEIDGFSHIVLVTHLHLVEDAAMTCDPPFADVEPGIFATRGPRRPNPIGLSIVRLTSRDDTVLSVESLDLVNGTPVLDVKPFAPKADALTGLRGGWIEDYTDQDVSALAPTDGGEHKP
ncbi:tRNA (N6-threonylcarbamoyladenosine(37)-N6)-methyltransferase TrmO [Natrinema gelatinilyticum]|uniref:tRNA (N6-threonylcarbamoyladenosine(37)-N6)-methyltransferase TrmO n=1 Tax=Natrinema gelatinilyticum TaxID=2961571 RepID=UPI0020C357A9|nr:tRNA (N6-threonylcarbamoyladenosine(37)-N6)-methyltransferase TrmO [Natrinema gelatinilyticum]